MNPYKYPVQYFCGAGAQIYPRDIFERNVKYFDNSVNMCAPIVGETGIDGVLLDFNYGLRLQIPSGDWHVRIADLGTHYVFLDADVSNVVLISLEKYYVEWEIALWLDGEPVFYHQFDPRGQKVHFLLRRPVLGDNIAMLPYLEQFRRQFECEVSCSIPNVFRGIMENYYPQFRLTNGLPDNAYACFYMQPSSNLPFLVTEDSLSIPLLRIGHTILRPIVNPPKIVYRPTESREIAEPYVCIGVQASSPSKGWLNPDGWERVVEYLKAIGYRVLCIDRDRECSDELNTVTQPDGVEDMSGGYNLIDRVNQLAYADFFIGVSSGLSWLAWACDIPVVMISGITARWYEFDTPYRVSNPLVCHGCFNEFHNLDAATSCPRLKDTANAFECSKKISEHQVIVAIERLIADRKLIGGARA